MAGSTGPVRRRTTIGELLPMTVQDTELLAAAQQGRRRAGSTARGMNGATTTGDRNGGA